jgi:ribosomal protein S17E
MALSKKEADELNQEFVDIGNDLKENEGITADIQTRTGKSLSNQSKRILFAGYMTKLYAEGRKAMVKRHQDCIDKAPTQRVMQGLASDATLTKKIKIRTANKGLIKKGIATEAQVKQKDVYHVLNFPISKPVELTAQERIQKDVTEYNISEDDFKAMTIKWFVKA